MLIWRRKKNHLNQRKCLHLIGIWFCILFVKLAIDDKVSGGKNQQIHIAKGWRNNKQARKITRWIMETHTHNLMNLTISVHFTFANRANKQAIQTECLLLETISILFWFVRTKVNLMFSVGPCKLFSKTAQRNTFLEQIIDGVEYTTNLHEKMVRKRPTRHEITVFVNHKIDICMQTMVRHFLRYCDCTRARTHTHQKLGFSLSFFHNFQTFFSPFLDFNFIKGNNFKENQWKYEKKLSTANYSFYKTKQTFERKGA